MKTILIIDDNPGHALLTEEAFKESFELDSIVHLHNGKQALEYLRYEGEYEGRNHENPSLILLDLNMPRVDGAEVLREIKSDAELRTIPVIMLTLSSSEPDIERCYKLGANAYVLKDFDYHRYKKEMRTLGEFWGFTNIGPSIRLTA